MGQDENLNEEIKKIRGNKGKIDEGRELRKMIEGYDIRRRKIEGEKRVKDKY